MKTSRCSFLTPLSVTACLLIAFSPVAKAATVAAPVFSPVAGTYTAAQSVTIGSTTSGAAIRFTTDGSAPTSTSGTVYTGPVSVSATTTLKAIAYQSGWDDSAVNSALFTIAAPSTITLVQPVKICPNTNTCSFNTTPGTGNQVVVLIAVEGFPTTISASDNQGDIYTAFPVATGTYRSTLKGFITGAVAASGTFTVTSTDNGGFRSLVMYEYSGLSTTFDGSAYRANAQASGVNGTCGTLTTTNPSDLIVAAVTSNVTNTPTNGFSSPFTLDAVIHNSRAAILSGHYVASAPTSGLLTNFTWGPNYNVGDYGCLQVGIQASPQAAATPAFSPAAGTYPSAQTVNISTTPGATIRYTIDGSTPTSTTGSIYGGPIAVNSSLTIKAIA